MFICGFNNMLDGGMIKERWFGKDLEGSGPHLIEALAWHLSGGTEENHENTSQGS
jgi:hypothetical protein